MSTKPRRTTRWTKRTRTAVGSLVVVAVVAWAQTASAAPKDKVDVVDLTTGAQVAGAFSMLERAEDGITTKLRTRARAGHAYTLWYVIFNAPQNCSGGVCGEDDVFVDPSDHSGGFDAARIAATRVSIVAGDAGAIANAAGRLKLDGGLAVGEVPGGPAQVVIGRGEDGALVPLGVVTGLEDAERAVIISVVLDHGAAHEDPALLAMQLTSFEGACNPECAEVQMAAHVP